MNKESDVSWKFMIAAKKKKRGVSVYLILVFCALLPIILGYPLVYNIILSFKNVNVKRLLLGVPRHVCRNAELH